MVCLSLILQCHVWYVTLPHDYLNPELVTYFPVGGKPAWFSWWSRTPPCGAWHLSNQSTDPRSLLSESTPTPFPQRKSSLFCHSTLNSDETNVRSGYHPDLCSISFNSKEGALVILGIFSQATSILPFYRPVKLKNLVLLWEFCSFTFLLRMRWILLPTRYSFSYQSSLYSQKT